MWPHFHAKRGMDYVMNLDMQSAPEDKTKQLQGIIQPCLPTHTTSYDIPFREQLLLEYQRFILWLTETRIII